jgi:hypothetical protein
MEIDSAGGRAGSRSFRSAILIDAMGLTHAVQGGR